MNTQKNLSFAELKSMETSNAKRVPPSATPDFGNSQDRVGARVEDKLTLKTNIPLDFDLLSQEPVNKSSDKLKAKVNRSVESSKFKRLNQTSSKDPSFQNSIQSGSIRSGRKSFEKKSKSLVYAFKKSHLKSNHTKRGQRHDRKSRNLNPNSLIVQNIRRRKERQSTIQNRSTSKKKRNRNMFEFSRNHRTINNDRDSEDSFSRKNRNFYQSQQNHQMGFQDNRFQSNPRTPKSRFSKRGSKTQQDLDGPKRPKKKSQPRVNFESKRYVNFETSKHDIFDSNVLSNGHQSASQSIPKLMINGHKSQKPDDHELNQIETQHSMGGCLARGHRS